MSDISWGVSVNPRNNYWIVGGSTTLVYSSSKNIYVPVDDADYVAWLQNNPSPHNMTDEAELWDTITRMDASYLPVWLFDGETFVQPAVGEYTKNQLLGYSSSVRYECEIEGTTSTGQSLRTDRVSRTAADQTLAYINANPGTTVNWKTLTGFEIWDQTKITQYVTDINRHVQECYDAELTVSNDVNAGTITTLAQVDAAYGGVFAHSARIKKKIEI